ncbi:MAG: UDP-N-acetylmuramate--L-alanine ligase [Chlamydiales bacterium]|nr:UDP-N-acetylmuramate--L-alanine ligase [Chlamydiales bacterium]
MKNKNYHFIGIGGIGMSALAHILLDKKISVSGSDVSTSTLLDQLQKKGAQVKKGHASAHISAHDTVVYSSGIQQNNPELVEAKSLNCNILHRSELLAELMQGQRTFVCCGTHGKTTTTSLLAAALVEGGMNPSYAIGGLFKGLNGQFGQEGGCFVAEGDESDGTFLNYYPDGGIITNVEPEHMEHYKTPDVLYQAFDTFFSQVANPEQLFYCGDDAVLMRLARGRGISYGFSAHCTLHLSHYHQAGWKSYFDLSFEGRVYKAVEIALVGEHQALNAAAVFGLALSLGVEEKKIRAALATFPGIGRRCEKKQERGGALFLDDYAHHPTEIEKTLGAIKEAVEERRLVVLFQPHRYTRTRDTLEALALAFESADYVYVTDVYTAGETPIEGVTAQNLVKKIQEHSTVPCSYLSKHKWAEIRLQPHDVFVSMGAGDVTHAIEQVAAPQRLSVGVVFGGASCEHEISLRSARFVAASLDRHLYEVRYFGIDKEGRWVTGDAAQEILKNDEEVSSPLCRPIFEVIKELEACDLFLPILHGTYGEDGTLQGFFEILGKPYLGPDYRACALSMDKVLTKRLVASYGVATPKDLSFGHVQWNQKKEKLLYQIEQTLTYPLYVKPVHLGSSVGISYVEVSEKLEAAIEKAFRFDTMVMIEEGKVGCRELEFAVVGNSHAYRVMAPAPGEKLAAGTFVDYAKKYGSQSVQTTVTPTLPADLIEKGRQTAAAAYQAVGCSGMTRVDFLLDQEGKYWFFEMNPIPGLQSLSLFPKIWKREGVEPEQLFNRLIILSLQRKRQQDRHFQCLNS